MIENHRSGLLWSLMRDCPAIIDRAPPRGIPQRMAERERR